MGLTRGEKRKVILEAASEVLLEYGSQKTTLEDIAKKAGMAKTSLYYYFKDKNEIIRAIITSFHEQLFAVISEAVAAATSAEDKMIALSEARYLFISTKSLHANKKLTDDFRSLAGVFDAERDHYLLAHKELIENILHEGIEKGELKPIDDLEFVSLIMVSSMFGCDSTFAFYDQQERLLEGMRNMVKIFFAGLRVTG